MSHKRKPTTTVLRKAREAETRERALAVLALSRRERLSLRTAARIEGIRPSTVLRYTKSGFKKRGNNWFAKASDRLPRTLTIVDPKGLRPVTVLGPRAASRIAEYWNAVKKAHRTGDYSGLSKFKGKPVPGGGFRFVTSPAKLAMFADAGFLDFEKIYWRAKVV